MPDPDGSREPHPCQTWSCGSCGGKRWVTQKDVGVELADPDVPVPCPDCTDPGHRLTEEVEPDPDQEREGLP